MGLVDDALKRQQDRSAVYKPIDYARMSRVHPKQKAALTRVKKTGDPEKIAKVVKAAIEEWNQIGAWPDDWVTWQIALNDALPYWQQIDIKDL